MVFTLSALMDKDKRLMEASWGRDWLWEKLHLLSELLFILHNPASPDLRQSWWFSFCFISYHMVLNTLLSVSSPSLWGLPLRAKCMSSWSLHLYLLSGILEHTRYLIKVCWILSEANMESCLKNIQNFSVNINEAQLPSSVHVLGNKSNWLF